MKEVVIALLTTTINRYSELKFDRNLIPTEMITKDLLGILDYVADIPEDNQPITVTLTSTQVEILRKRIEELEEHKMQAFKYQQQLICRIEELKKRKNELEETCEANNEVIDKQFQKIQRLQKENKLFGGDK